MAKKKAGPKKSQEVTLPASVRFRDPTEMPSMALPEIRLTGKLVDLLPLRLNDIEDIQVAASKATIFQWFIDGWIILRVGVGAYVNEMIQDRMRPDGGLPFSVYHRGLRRIIGVVRLYDVHRSDHTVSMATWYAEQFHGTGVNTETKYLLLRHVFEVLHGQRVKFDIDKNNVGSIGAIKSIGAKFEGRHESNIRLPNGEQRTSMIFAINKDTWPAAKLKMERKLRSIYKEMEKE